MTFADRIGNAQRGIGPLHLTGMFPGSATPEEWITSDPEATPMEGLPALHLERTRKRMASAACCQMKHL